MDYSRFVVSCHRRLRPGRNRRGRWLGADAGRTLDGLLVCTYSVWLFRLGEVRREPPLGGRACRGHGDVICARLVVWDDDLYAPYVGESCLCGNLGVSDWLWRSRQSDSQTAIQRLPSVIEGATTAAPGSKEHLFGVAVFAPSENCCRLCSRSRQKWPEMCSGFTP